jgi:hypothetical protein
MIGLLTAAFMMAAMYAVVPAIIGLFFKAKFIHTWFCWTLGFYFVICFFLIKW